MALKSLFKSLGQRPDFMVRAIFLNVKEQDVTAHDVQNLGDGSAELSEVKVNKDGTLSISHESSGHRYDQINRMIDRANILAGTWQFFAFICVILVVWVVIGIVFGASQNWQIVMQDGQSIQSYIWDTLLMRQQNSAHENALMCGQLRSRTITFRRLVQFRAEKHPDLYGDGVNGYIGEPDDSDPILNDSSVSTELPTRNWFDRLSTNVAKVLGSVWTIALYWCGIFVWIGTGALYIPSGNPGPYTGDYSGSNPKYQKFGNNWQMYINTATAVLILLSTVFLQNIEARHGKFTVSMLKSILEVEKEIDKHFIKYYHLKDYVTIQIPAQTRLRGEHAIDWYADVMGTGVGVILALVVFAIWVGIGDLLSWSSDWWLIIGTYTGLVGFLDGFVLRQVYYGLVQFEEHHYALVAEDDLRLMDALQIKCPEEFTGKPTQPAPKLTFQLRLSHFIDRICSSRYSVLFAIVCIITLICISSALKWTTTGQLISNTPTMIMEEFFLLVLIQAHNWAEAQRRNELYWVYQRRRIIHKYLDTHNLSVISRTNTSE